MKTATCAGCGEDFRVRADRRALFCSPRCAGRAHSGRRNYNYKGGLCRRTDGRWVIYCRDGSLVLFARAVMAAEIGRLLTPDEIVHHRNGDVEDDRPENLEITTRSAHIEIHRQELLAARR